MPRLILIKHAAPVKDEHAPSRDWQLSDDGKAQAAKLAEQLRGLSIETIVTSDEPKARQTGEIIAAALGVPVSVGQDLHEHDRSNVPVMPTREFISSVALFFKEPTRLVLGVETASAARSRICSAIDEVIQTNAGKNIAIVSHGTVISLYAADLLQDDPFQLWRRMRLPSYLVIDLEADRAERVVDHI